MKLMQKQLLIYKQRGHTVLPGVIWNIGNKQNDYSLMFKELQKVDEEKYQHTEENIF